MSCTKKYIGLIDLNIACPEFINELNYLSTHRPGVKLSLLRRLLSERSLIRLGSSKLLTSLNNLKSNFMSKTALELLFV